MSYVGNYKIFNSIIHTHKTENKNQKRETRNEKREK